MQKGLKIVLVNTSMATNPFSKAGFYAPPYWAAVLARKIKDREHEAGIKHEAKLLDLQIYDYKRVSIDKRYYKDVDAVLISGMIQCYPQMIEVSNFYRKKNKDTKIIFGGWGPTSLYYERKKFENGSIDLNEQIFQFCDAAVIGEAEVVLTELLEDLEQKKLRQNDYYIGAPAKWGWVMPDFSIWPRGQYAFGAIQTQRGCPNDCSFCSVSSVLGTRVREKPVDFVRKELRLMLATHGFDLIFFYDDNIIGSRNGRYAFELFTMFKGDFPKTKWFSQCGERIVHLPEVAKLFGESRCVLLLIGFETLNTDCLKEFGSKNEKNADNNTREDAYGATVRLLRDNNILARGCFVFGFKHTTEEEIRHTLEFAVRSKLLMYQMTILTPQPGTPLFREMQGSLLYDIKPENWGKYDFMQPTTRRGSGPGIDNKALVDLISASEKEFYARINILRMLRKSRVPKMVVLKCMRSAVKKSMLSRIMAPSLGKGKTEKNARDPTEIPKSLEFSEKGILKANAEMLSLLKERWPGIQEHVHYYLSAAAHGPYAGKAAGLRADIDDIDLDCIISKFKSGKLSEKDRDQLFATYRLILNLFVFFNANNDIKNPESLAWFADMVNGLKSFEKLELLLKEDTKARTGFFSRARAGLRDNPAAKDFLSSLPRDTRDLVIKVLNAMNEYCASGALDPASIANFGAKLSPGATMPAILGNINSLAASPELGKALNYLLLLGFAVTTIGALAAIIPRVSVDAEGQGEAKSVNSANWAQSVAALGCILVAVSLSASLAAPS